MWINLTSFSAVILIFIFLHQVVFSADQIRAALFCSSPSWILTSKPLFLQNCYVCYVSVKSNLQHAPPGNPPGIWPFWKLLFKFPPTRAKMPFKCPTLGSIQVIKCPHPGDISQAHNDRRTAETPSVVEQNLYKYNKNWETLLAYLLQTKVSCKAAEIAATR